MAQSKSADGFGHSLWLIVIYGARAAGFNPCPRAEDAQLTGQEGCPWPTADGPARPLSP